MHRPKRGKPDFIIFFAAVMLLVIGIVMVFSASSVVAYMDKGDTFFYLKRQFLWASIGVLAMIMAMNFEYYHLHRFADLIFLLALSLLVLVLFAGISSHGSSRWLGVGPLSFQPSEAIKIAIVIFMAKSLSGNQDKIHSFFRGVIPHIAVLMLACGLIVGQPDLGTAVAVAGTVYLMFAASGVKFSHLAMLAMAGLGLIATAIMIEPYRFKRFLAFLDPWADPMETGFQTIQSLLALGSGGLFGMGLGQSRQKFFYLPERHTDFIYAILGEELGFIGASLVLLLFVLILWRGFKVALTVKDKFGSLLAVGITCMIVLQMIINVAVVTGSMPVTGITLPLVSYGGSSLVFTLIGIGILLNISRYAADK
ncbi:MAG: putative lipid II flippase FtsW [Clostridia bacterium]|nr:putative lipid II flippase FtsW [Clostridia bacterium]